MGEHIKENCPEEVYKEAVKHRIEADAATGTEKEPEEKKGETKTILYVVLGVTVAFALLFLTQIVLILILTRPLIITARVFSVFSMAVVLFLLPYAVKKGGHLSILLTGMALLFGLISLLFAFVL